MKWKIENELIFDGDRLVGSIVTDLKAGTYGWSVEILWSPTMDLKSKAYSHDAAMGFIEGVEKTFVALGVKEEE